MKKEFVEKLLKCLSVLMIFSILISSFEVNACKYCEKEHYSMIKYNHEKQRYFEMPRGDVGREAIRSALKLGEKDYPNKVNENDVFHEAISKKGYVYFREDGIVDFVQDISTLEDSERNYCLSGEDLIKYQRNAKVFLKLKKSEKEKYLVEINDENIDRVKETIKAEADASIREHNMNVIYCAMLMMESKQGKFLSNREIVYLLKYQQNISITADIPTFYRFRNNTDEKVVIGLKRLETPIIHTVSGMPAWPIFEGGVNCLQFEAMESSEDDKDFFRKYGEIIDEVLDTEIRTARIIGKNTVSCVIPSAFLRLPEELKRGCEEVIGEKIARVALANRDLNFCIGNLTDNAKEGINKVAHEENINLIKNVINVECDIVFLHRIDKSIEQIFSIAPHPYKCIGNGCLSNKCCQAFDERFARMAPAIANILNFKANPNLFALKQKLGRNIPFKNFSDNKNKKIINAENVELSNNHLYNFSRDVENNCTISLYNANKKEVEKCSFKPVSEFNIDLFKKGIKENYDRFFKETPQGNYSISKVLKRLESKGLITNFTNTFSKGNTGICLLNPNHYILVNENNQGSYIISHYKDKSEIESYVYKPTDTYNYDEFIKTFKDNFEYFCRENPSATDNFSIVKSLKYNIKKTGSINCFSNVEKDSIFLKLDLNLEAVIEPKTRDAYKISLCFEEITYDFIYIKIHNDYDIEKLMNFIKSKYEEYSEAFNAQRNKFNLYKCLEGNKSIDICVE